MGPVKSILVHLQASSEQLGASTSVDIALVVKLWLVRHRVQSLSDLKNLLNPARYVIGGFSVNEDANQHAADLSCRVSSNHVFDIATYFGRLVWNAS